ncbi:hypothetical protein [Oceanicaulis alexandrii]|uniref:hypothetical protein n=1 Tax=Oceanicaulis alexandrii TaxID=153233 RepID=UPI0023543C36|nr:hypothetical protein [Oceanicaulis alexandrii]
MDINSMKSFCIQFRFSITQSEITHFALAMDTVMQKLTDFTIKSFERTAHKGATQKRRANLLAKLTEQFDVLAAAKRGEKLLKTKTVWTTNSDGERVQTQRSRAVRAWFFEQDGGWYVQCRYGAKALRLNDKGNALFVTKLENVEQALAALRSAVSNGEMDDAIAEALKGRVSAGIPRKPAKT